MRICPEETYLALAELAKKVPELEPHISRFKIWMKFGEDESTEDYGSDPDQIDDRLEHLGARELVDDRWSRIVGNDFLNCLIVAIERTELLRGSRVEIPETAKSLIQKAEQHFRTVKKAGAFDDIDMVCGAIGFHESMDILADWISTQYPTVNRD